MTKPTELLIVSKKDGGTVYRRVRDARQVKNVTGQLVAVHRRIDGVWMDTAGKPVDVPEEFNDVY